MHETFILKKICAFSLSKYKIYRNFCQKKEENLDQNFLQNVKYCKLIVCWAIICLIFIFSVPDESSYCYVNTANKKSRKFVQKVKLHHIICSNLVNLTTLTIKVKHNNCNKKESFEVWNDFNDRNLINVSFQIEKWFAPSVKRNWEK